MDGISAQLTSQRGGWGAKTGLYLTKEPMAMDLYNKKNRNECPSLTNPCHNTIRITENHRIRRLTPTEAERLQGFSDGWTKFGNYDGKIKPISDSQRYKMLGNAVSVPVIRAIGKRLKTGTK